MSRSKQRLHCRVGSLETEAAAALNAVVLHCRVGSLESVVTYRAVNAWLHCRVGSLEKCDTNVITIL